MVDLGVGCGHKVFETYPIPVEIWSVEFMIASSSTLNFIAAAITESITFVFIVTGLISPPKIILDQSMYISTVYKSWTSANSSKISPLYGTNFSEKCPNFWLYVGW